MLGAGAAEQLVEHHPVVQQRLAQCLGRRSRSARAADAARAIGRAVAAEPALRQLPRLPVLVQRVSVVHGSQVQLLLAVLGRIADRGEQAADYLVGLLCRAARVVDESLLDASPRAL